MAILVPSLASCVNRMTSGERRFAQRLQSHLEDDYLCWYDVPLGAKQRHPDFIILHPARGLLILEVKDWKIESVREATRTSVALLTARGIEHLSNPLEQARQYAFAVKELLEQDSALQVIEGFHRGKLAVPYGYGVVLSRITRKTFEASDLDEVIEPSRVICQDELMESVDAADFQKRLWAMQSAPFQRLLSMPQIERIRWHLFPEIRIGASQDLFENAGEVSKAPLRIHELVRVMDLQQEQLARSLGEGHRVIHGVAGSGKTLILGYRAEHLAKLIRKPILVLCYNVALAAKLRHLIKEKGLSDQVVVHSFHAWCSEQLQLYHVARPHGTGDAFYAALVAGVVKGVEDGHIPRAQYGAVLIDEGHDFKPEWIRLVAQMIDPDSNAFLLLYDDAQSIYGESVRRKFSLSSVGVQAKGRTTILRLNYRNTSEVLAVAYEFAKEVLTPNDAGDDEIPLILPTSVGRHGPVPELVKLSNLAGEGDFIAGHLHEQKAQGRGWRDMAVLYRDKFMGEKVVARLRVAGVPVEWLQETKQSRNFHPDHDSVKVMTLHSSKGLEFAVVAIAGVGFMPYTTSKPAEEARLLYVGMTRAVDQLVITCHKDSEFSRRLENACERLAA